MQTAWSMTLKETQELEGAEPGVQYFVQEDTDWYSNEAGNFIINSATHRIGYNIHYVCS